MKKRWSEQIAAMPKLTLEQSNAVLEILDYRMSSVAGDFPAADEAVYMTQSDIESITEEAT